MKNTTLLKNLASAAIFALALGATVSCDPNENGGEDTTKYVLELANPNDANIVIEAEAEDLVTVALKLENITPDQVKVEKKEADMTWCAASAPDSKGVITITPALENPNETDYVAGFIVSTTIPNVPSIEFTVIKKGNSSEVEYTLEMESSAFTPDDYMNTIRPDAVGAQSVTITITTTAPYWYLNMMMDADWMTFDKTYGKSGETCTITFADNKSVPSVRNAQISFNYNNEFSSKNMIMIAQPSFPATNVKIFAFDAETETSGQQLNTNHAVSFKATEGTYPFVIESDGGLDFKWAQTGSSEFFEPDYDYWASQGIDFMSGQYYTIHATKNDEPERSVDLVLVPAGGTTEFFRFKITQAGAAE